MFAAKDTDALTAAGAGEISPSPLPPAGAAEPAAAAAVSAGEPVVSAGSRRRPRLAAAVTSSSAVSCMHNGQAIRSEHVEDV